MDLKTRIIVFVGLIGLFVVSAVLAVYAHDAPTGWSYPMECCHQLDCGPVVKTDFTDPKDGSLRKLIVTIEKQGTFYTAVVDTTFPVRQSPDNLMHACIRPPAVDQVFGRLICLFVPPTG